MWTWVFWWPYALGEAGVVSVQFPPFFEPLGGLGLLLVMGWYAYRDGKWSKIRAVLGRTTEVKQPVQWWLVSLLPALLLLISIATYTLIVNPTGFGVSVPLSPILLVGFFLAWVEEVVWRGYALPELLVHHTPAQASLLLSVVWVLWHLPLYFIPEYSEWGFGGWLAWIPWYVAYTYFLTWLGIRTRYSVFLATLSHFAVNWVIRWYAPSWLENVGALGGGVLLGILMLIVYTKLRNAESNDPHWVARVSDEPHVT
jgi:membrane protease YdiL (CAAX protease family)